MSPLLVTAEFSWSQFSYELPEDHYPYSGDVSDSPLTAFLSLTDSK